MSPGTITITKIQYNNLNRQAKLYQMILKSDERIFPIELYSKGRLKEFLEADKISPKMRTRIMKFIKK